MKWWQKDQNQGKNKLNPILLFFFFLLDINECEIEPPITDCDLNATCENIPGDYLCMCSDGFYGNGTHCSLLGKITSYIFQKRGVFLALWNSYINVISWSEIAVTIFLIILLSIS